MLILGIDPGSRKIGYGLIWVQGKKLTYVTSGVLRFDHIETFLDRLGEIYLKITQLLVECQKVHPNFPKNIGGKSESIKMEVAIESLIYVKSVTSLAKLAEARGAIISAIKNQECVSSVEEYSPNLIKSSVTGHGHASKEAVDKALGFLFGEIKFKTHDESDALAIATCHAMNRTIKNLQKKHEERL